VYIDRMANDPAGEYIVVEDCEKVTRQLQHVLEVEGCAYERLEVSSPGLDRPLKKPADYQRFAGQEIELSLKLAFQGRKHYRGVLEAQPEGWRLVLKSDTKGKADQALDFSLEEVKEARLVPVVDFKGRRFLPAEQPQGDTATADDVDGDRKQ
jgi:ribosome maturation factor RimP